MAKPELKQPIFLSGMMGSGKSTVGQTLAVELNVTFQDLDDLIEEEAGMVIPEIFTKKGEPAFRELERKILIAESQKTDGVLALGGGSLQNQRIVDHLKIYGWLIFLEVPLSVIYDRISGDQNRPMLDGSNGFHKLETLLNERRPLYRQAHITIQAGSDTPEDLTQKIIKKLTMYDGFRRR